MMKEKKRDKCLIEVDMNTVRVTYQRVGDDIQSVVAGNFNADDALLLNTNPGKENISHYGRKLFNLLTEAERVSNAFSLSEHAACVQLCIRFPIDIARELLEVSWEHLCNKEGDFLAKNRRYRFLRQFTNLRIVKPVVTDQPRVLVVIANPREGLAKFGEELKPLESPLDTRQTEGLNQLFGGLKEIGAIEYYRILRGPYRDPRKNLPETILTKWPTPENISDELENGKYHIVHFLAHGYLEEHGREGKLILTNDEGKAEPISQKTLTELFPIEHQVMLVVFAACQSGDGDQIIGEPLAGLAPDMLQSGIPAVIAMQGKITIGGAFKFTERFYKKFFEHGCVDRATLEARRRIRGDEWYMPVLYSQSESSRLFDKFPQTSQNPQNVAGRMPVILKEPISNSSIAIGLSESAPRNIPTRRPTSHHKTDLAPFIVGPPILDPRCFFGREDALKRIFGVWNRFPVQNVAIIGARRSGKTSLLHYLKTITTSNPADLRPGQRFDWLSQPEHFRWVFVDFQDARMMSQKRLIRHILTSLDMPVPDPCDLGSFMDIVSEHLNTPTIILMDEIGAALAAPELDLPFWWSLRSLCTNFSGGSLGFLLTSHEPPGDLAHEFGKPSPFFNIFGHMIQLGPMSETAARELIASSPKPFEPADVEWLLSQSGLWPILLQGLCYTRLTALENGESGESWKENALGQITPYRYLLEET